MPRDDEPAAHPDAGDLSAYLDGALSGAERSRVEAHLADCMACRAEVAAVAQVLRTAPSRRRLVLPIGVAAAAVLAVLIVPALDRTADPGRFREPAVTTAAPPLAIEPRGTVESVHAMVWSAVPRAARYRVLLLDARGAAVWRVETTDTTAVLPDSVRRADGAAYFWKVEAETGIDRWVASELADFTTRVREP